jgi:protein TonB
MRTDGEKFGRWVGMSVALHGALFATVLVWPALLSLRGDATWGTSTGGNDGIQVKITSGLPGIPLPSPPVVREEAVPNESSGLHTTEPAPKAKPEEKADDTPKIQIPTKSTPKKPAVSPRKTASAPDVPPAPSNAVPYGEGGRPAVQYGQIQTGAGQAGYSFGDGSFGELYGWYVRAMTQRISENWSQASSTNLRSAPRVYVSFSIARDGTINDFKIDQSSGIPSLDQSAERAIRRSNPLGSLPPQYRGSNVTVRFYFEYVR